MFSPDIWSFDPPNHLITHKYEQLTEKMEKQLRKKIQNHHFNKMVRIKLSIRIW